MDIQLNRYKILIVGGDAREIILATRLVAVGASVKVVGLPIKNEKIELYEEIIEGLRGVDIVILPVPGINDRGEVHMPYSERKYKLSKDVFCNLPAGTPIIVGVARQALRNMVKECGLKLIEVMNLDEVAILNSIPSAEGAIQIAMEKSLITIHGSRSLVLGFGRTGMTLARMLHVLSSKVTVVARDAAQRARAVEMGLEAVDISILQKKIVEVDFIFNTIPAMIIDKVVLKKIKHSALIIDLASSPGGTDFKIAEERGIKAILAPGLPGKVAPKTAGNILADIIPKIIVDELSSRVI